MIRKALEDDPATLEYLVFGKDALFDHVKGNEAAFLRVVARILPVFSEGGILFAKEIDAIKAAIEARNDESDTV